MDKDYTIRFNIVEDEFIGKLVTAKHWPNILTVLLYNTRGLPL